MKKEELKIDIIEGFSADLLTAITAAKFGTVEAVGSPSDVDSAIIVTGIVNANFNNAILVPLSGLPIVELILKNGQLNDIYRGLLYSAIEVSPDYADFDILEPIPDVSYATGENSISINITHGTAENITCSVYPPSNAGFAIGEFTQEGDTYFAPISYDETGTYSLTFSVRFSTGALLSKGIEALVE